MSPVLRSRRSAMNQPLAASVSTRCEKSEPILISLRAAKVSAASSIRPRTGSPICVIAAWASFVHQHEQHVADDELRHRLGTFRRELLELGIAVTQRQRGDIDLRLKPPGTPGTLLPMEVLRSMKVLRWKQTARPREARPVCASTGWEEAGAGCAKAGSALLNATSRDTQQQSPGIVTPRTITTGHHCYGMVIPSSSTTSASRAPSTA